MKHQDYIDIFKTKGEWDGDCYIIWTDRTFWDILQGYYTDILGAFMGRDIHNGGYGVSFLVSTPDDRQQIFENFGSFPYHIQKKLINDIKNY